MDAASGMMKVDKLDTTNYFSWKEKNQLVLSLRELDEFIEEEPPAEDAEDYRDRKRANAVEKWRFSEGTYHTDPKIHLSDLD